MFIKNFVLFLAVISLLGCNSNSDSNGNSANPSPQQNKVQETSNDYSQSANLNLIETNEQINKIDGNSVTLKGTGSKSTYKINYAFKSGNSNSFKILETKLDAGYSNCSGPDTRMVLKNKNQSREVSLAGTYNVDPNEDYTLEVSFVNSGCVSLALTFDVLAWVGFSSEDPKIALVCENNHVGQTTFVLNVNALTALSGNNEKFLSKDTYCGEKISPAKITCSTSGNLDIRSKTASKSTVRCTAEGTDSKRSFKADLDTADKTAVVTCQNDGKATFAEIFRSCEIGVIDYKQFQ